MAIVDLLHSTLSWRMTFCSVFSWFLHSVIWLEFQNICHWWYDQTKGSPSSEFPLNLQTLMPSLCWLISHLSPFVEWERSHASIARVVVRIWVRSDGSNIHLDTWPTEIVGIHLVAHQIMCHFLPHNTMIRGHKFWHPSRRHLCDAEGIFQNKFCSLTWYPHTDIFHGNLSNFHDNGLYTMFILRGSSHLKSTSQGVNFNALPTS